MSRDFKNQLFTDDPATLARRRQAFNAFVHDLSNPLYSDKLESRKAPHDNLYKYQAARMNVAFNATLNKRLYQMHPVYLANKYGVSLKDARAQSERMVEALVEDKDYEPVLLNKYPWIAFHIPPPAFSSDDLSEGEEDSTYHADDETDLDSDGEYDVVAEGSHRSSDFHGDGQRSASTQASSAPGCSDEEESLYFGDVDDDPYRDGESSVHEESDLDVGGVVDLDFDLEVDGLNDVSSTSSGRSDDGQRRSSNQGDESGQTDRSAFFSQNRLSLFFSDSEDEDEPPELETSRVDRAIERARARQPISEFENLLIFEDVSLLANAPMSLQEDFELLKFCVRCWDPAFNGPREGGTEDEDDAAPGEDGEDGEGAVPTAPRPNNQRGAVRGSGKNPWPLLSFSMMMSQFLERECLKDRKLKLWGLLPHSSKSTKFIMLDKLILKRTWKRARDWWRTKLGIQRRREAHFTQWCRQFEDRITNLQLKELSIASFFNPPRCPKGYSLASTILTNGYVAFCLALLGRLLTLVSLLYVWLVTRSYELHFRFEKRVPKSVHRARDDLPKGNAVRVSVHKYLKNHENDAKFAPLLAEASKNLQQQRAATTNEPQNSDDSAAPNGSGTGIELGSRSGLSEPRDENLSARSAVVAVELESLSEEDELERPRKKRHHAPSSSLALSDVENADAEAMDVEYAAAYAFAEAMDVDCVAAYAFAEAMDVDCVAAAALAEAMDVDCVASVALAEAMDVDCVADSDTGFGFRESDTQSRSVVANEEEDEFDGLERPRKRKREVSSSLALAATGVHMTGVDCATVDVEGPGGGVADAVDVASVGGQVEDSDGGRVPPYEFLMEHFAGCDPGHHNVLKVVTPAEPLKREDGTPIDWRRDEYGRPLMEERGLTLHEYNQKSGRWLVTKKLRQIQNGRTMNVQEIDNSEHPPSGARTRRDYSGRRSVARALHDAQRELARHTLKTMDPWSFLDAVHVHSQLYPTVYNAYHEKEFLKAKFQCKRQTQKTIDLLLNDVTFNRTKIVGLGHGTKVNGLKGCGPGPPIKRIRKIASKKRYPIFVVDENCTSLRSSCCEGANLTGAEIVVEKQYRVWDRAKFEETGQFRTMLVTITHRGRSHTTRVCNNCGSESDRDYSAAIQILRVLFEQVVLCQKRPWFLEYTLPSFEVIRIEPRGLASFDACWQRRVAQAQN
jgi:hypothetical protein